MQIWIQNIRTTVVLFKFPILTKFKKLAMHNNVFRLNVINSHNFSSLILVIFLDIYIDIVIYKLLLKHYI